MALSMAPLSGTKNLGPLKGFLFKNPMFWLILWLQNAASWTYNITLVMKGKYIMDGRKCLWSLFEQYFILHVAHVGLPNPRELVYLLPMRELPRTRECFVCMTGE